MDCSCSCTCFCSCSGTCSCSIVVASVVEWSGVAVVDLLVGVVVEVAVVSVAEGSLEVKLPTICRDGKAEVGRVREEKSRSEKIRDGESQKRQDAGARKGREVAIHYVFPMICGSGGSKRNLAKAAGAEPAGQMRDEKVRAVVARSTFPSQKGKKKPHVWSTFGS